MAWSRAGKRRAALVAVVALLALAGAGAFGVHRLNRERQLGDALRDGMAAYESGEWDDAIDRLNYYISRRRDNPEALLAFADARRRVELPNGAHVSQAIVVTQAAAALRPADLRPREQLMDLYESAGYVTELNTAAERVLELDPKHRRALELRVAALQATGRADETLAAAQKLSEAYPDDVDALRALVASLAEADRPVEELRAVADRMLAAHPNDLAFELLRFDVLVEIARRTGSEQHARDALGVLTAAAALPAPDALLAQDLLIRLDMHAPALADETLTRLSGVDSLRPKLASFAAGRAWKRLATDETSRIVREAYADLSQAPEDALGWASLSRDEAFAPEARAALASRATPEAQAWLKVIAGADALGEGDVTGARRLLAEAPTIGAAGEAATFLRGSLSLTLGEPRQAIQVWSALLAQHPHWRRARIEMARASLEVGEPGEARRMLRWDPDSTRRTYDESMLLLSAEVMLDESGATREPGAEPGLVLAERAAQAAPADATLLSLLARARLAAGDAPGAAEAVDRLLSLDSMEGASQWIIALEERIRATDPDRAARLIAALGSGQHADARGVLAAAMAMARAGNAGEGRSLIERSIEDAEGADLRLRERMLALYLDAAGDPGALQTLLALSEKYPDDVQVQLDVLRTESIWSDPASAQRPVERLREATGESGTRWRVFDARRRLLTESGAQAATAVALSLADVLRADPSNTQALELSAQAFERVGDYGRAADYLLRAREADPQAGASYPRTIGMLLRAGRTEEAEQRAREYAAADITEPTSLRERAALLERFGLLSEAIRDTERLAKLGDQLDSIRYASLLARSGRGAEGERLIADLVGKTKLTPDATVALAQHLAALGKVEDGLARIRTLPEESEAGRREELEALYLLRHKSGLEGVRQVEALARASTNPRVRLYAIEGLLGLGREEEARRALDAALAQTPEDPGLVSLQTALLPENRGGPVAIAAHVRSLLNESESPGVEELRGMLDNFVSRRLDTDSFIGALRELTTRNPSLYEAWRVLVDTLAANDQAPDAAQTALRAAEILPGDPRPARDATRMLGALRRWDDALFAARQWRQRSGADPFEADLAIAAIEFERANPSEAADVLTPYRDRIIAGAEVSGDADVLAAALAASGRVEDAHAVLWPLAGKSPEGAARYLNVARHIPNPDARRAWIERVTTHLAQDDPTTFTLALAWYQLAARSGAATDFDRVLDIAASRVNNPTTGPEFALLAASAYENRAQPDRAIAMYRAVLAAQPENPDALNNLAYLLLSTNAPGDEAVSLARRALQAATTRGGPTSNYADTLGCALLKSGNAAEAQKVFADALARDGQAPYLQVGLIEALLANGDTPQAQRELRRLPAQLPPHLDVRIQSVRAKIGG